MPARRILAPILLLLGGGAVAGALAGLPGAPAACLPADCDCEAPRDGPIRQPANAWSSWALVAAGVFVLIRAPGPAGTSGPVGSEARRHITRQVTAAALVGAGLAAFLYHAGLTAWTARLDGIAVAVLVGAAACHAGTRRPHLLRRGQAGAPTQGGPGARGPTRRLLTGLAPGLLLGVGGLAWWLGRSGGPWCRPESLLQAHAAWHLLAASAAAAWLHPRRGPGESRAPNPPGLYPRAQSDQHL